MTKDFLVRQIREKKTCLCIGLDSDVDKIPSFLREKADPIFEFNKQIIDATKEHTVAYKINTAFYESQGARGWESMSKTVDYIPDSIFKIADAKRGDIGNTCKMYAKAFFEQMNFDAVTLAPYMGRDSILPFLEYEGKWSIILGLTSNPSSADFEMQKVGDKYLFEEVIAQVAAWGTANNTMFVVGATQTEHLSKIRAIVPDHFFLVPGVGAQGGSLQEVTQFGSNKDVGLLINSSRGIIYASDGEDFADQAKKAAIQLNKNMNI